MLNTFPGLLTFGFFAPMILRVAVAAFFFYLAYIHLRNQDHLSRYRLPLLGQQLGVLVWAVIALYALTGATLAVGYHTQIASLVAIATIVLHLMLRRSYPMKQDISTGAYTLMIVILFTLLLSGAGALAMDLPL